MPDYSLVGRVPSPPEADGARHPTFVIWAIVGFLLSLLSIRNPTYYLEP